MAVAEKVSMATTSACLIIFVSPARPFRRDIRWDEAFAFKFVYINIPQFEIAVKLFDNAVAVWLFDKNLID